MWLYLYLNSLLDGKGSQHQALAALAPERDQIPITQAAWSAPGPVWTCAENPTPTGTQSPDRQARSELLYRLHSCGVRIKASGSGRATRVQILLTCLHPRRREAIQWVMAVLPFHEGHIAGNAMLCDSLYYDGHISVLWGLNERNIDSQRGHDSSRSK